MEKVNMEILDCLCGIGPWGSREPRLPATPEETLALMDHFGIARALVYGNLIRENASREDTNRIAIEAARKSPRFTPAFMVRPATYASDPGINAQFNEMRRFGAKAVMLKAPGGPHLRGYWKWYIGGVLEACVAKRLPVLFHAEDTDPAVVHAICGDFPGLRLIISGVSYTQDEVIYPLLRQHKNMRVCLGHFYIPDEGLRIFLKHFAPDRILFGSGLPHYSPGGLIGHVMYSPIGDDVKGMILGGTLARLLSEVAL